MKKTLILIPTITISLLLIGITNLNSTKLQPEKLEINPINFLKESHKLYAPQIISPICPSSEYNQYEIKKAGISITIHPNNVLEYSDNQGQAQSQTVGVTTLHCSKCSLGALYEKDGKMICTYCNN